MTPVWRPDTAEAAQEAVREAAASRLGLRIIGRDSRNALGRPVGADVTLDLSSLNGIVDYQPEELVLTVLPATPMVEIEALLAANGQTLGFEPPDFGALWGAPAAGGTIGGCAMTGFGGPAQLTAGGPRDHCLGVKVVNGLGEVWMSGGRVVKNVTGFDMPKMICGSFGLLGVVTELTLKTTPARGEQRTLVLHGLDEAQATAAMAAGMASSANVAAAAYLPADIAVLSGCVAITASGQSATLLRLEGMPLSVEARAAALGASLSFPVAHVLGHHDSGTVWSEVANASLFAARPQTMVWRISTAPSAGAKLSQNLANSLGGRYFCDWAGGAVWLEIPTNSDPEALDIRPAVRAMCGPDAHSTIMRAPAELRASIAPFEPPSPAVTALTGRIKQRFDPYGLFNPGRMYGEM